MKGILIASALGAALLLGTPHAQAQHDDPDRWVNALDRMPAADEVEMPDLDTLTAHWFLSGAATRGQRTYSTLYDQSGPCPTGSGFMAAVIADVKTDTPIKGVMGCWTMGDGVFHIRPFGGDEVEVPMAGFRNVKDR